MPTIKTKAKAQAKPANGQPVADGATEPLVYAKLESFFAIGEDAITCAQARDMLRLQTESEHVAAATAANPKIKEGAAKFGEDFLFLDENGEKCRCWANTKNRPYDEVKTKGYIQDILNRKWAGEINYPGETINGETIVLSRSGATIQGQKRLIALVRAGQRWAKETHWQALWPTEPVLETVVIRGVSDHPAIIATLDNVQTRTLADTYYSTEEWWKKRGGVALDNRERREASRMLDAAIDLLWKRTAAGKWGYLNVQTHSASREFLGRHQRLRKCVKHLFEANEERTIGLAGLSAGQMSACMFLMASCESDVNAYRHHDPEPHEKALDWRHWDRAEEFWNLFAVGAKELKPLRAAVKKLKEVEGGQGGRQAEKLALVAIAWRAFLAKGKVGELALEYQIDPKGRVHIMNDPGFGGIDLNEVEEKDDDEDDVPEENAEAAKAELRRDKAKDAEEAIDAVKVSKANGLPKNATLAEEIEAIREQHGDKMLLFNYGNHYAAWGKDAADLAAILKVPVKQQSGLSRAEFPAKQLDQVLSRIVQAGYKIAVCEQVSKAKADKPAAAKPGGKTPPNRKGK